MNDFNKEKFSPKTQQLEFQKLAFKKLKDMEIGAIFYEQGLGKTKIAIDLILYWLKNNFLDTVFIAVKKNLVKNWYDEIRKHSFLVPTILSNKPAENTSVFLGKHNVIIFNYEIINNEFKRIENISKIRKIGIILDESAKIKNPESIISKKFHSIKEIFKKKIIMTGTPSANRPEDYWSQIFFLDNGKSLGPRYNFFFNSVKITNNLSKDKLGQHILQKNILDIKKKIDHFSIRETKDSSGLQLPEKVYKKIYCEFEENQFIIYNKALEKLKTKVVDESGELTEDLDDFLKRIIRLMQITSNPAMLDTNYKFETDRFIKTKNLVKEIIEKNEKVIIWTSYKFNIEFLSNNLTNFSPVILHGSLSSDIRNRMINSFLKNKDVKILIATPQSSKEGLTLINANHCIYYDRTLSLDDYLQSQDRIHRIGQTKKCYYYNLVISNSIDSWVDELIEAKSLFANLSLGDIDLTEFKKKINYNFGSIIRKILGIET